MLQYNCPTWKSTLCKVPWNLHILTCMKIAYFGGFLWKVHWNLTFWMVFDLHEKCMFWWISVKSTLESCSFGLIFDMHEKCIIIWLDFLLLAAWKEMWVHYIVYGLACWWCQKVQHCGFLGHCKCNVKYCRWQYLLSSACSCPLSVETKLHFLIYFSFYLIRIKPFRC